MVEWIVSSSVLIAVLILLRSVLKGKISLRLQYTLWALVLVRLLVPVSFGGTAMSVGNLTQKAAASETAQLVSALSETELLRMTYQAAYNEVAKEYADRGIQIEDMPLEEYAETVDYEIMNRMNGDLSIAEVVKIIWISGIAVVGIWFLLSNLRLSHRLKKTRSLLSGDHVLSVYLSDAIDTPCLFGLFRPAIYLTSKAAEDEHTMRHAVEHELTHHRHQDNIWAILRSVCLAVHWYNPLVWCAAVLSRNDAELACDESTILRLGEDERASYGRTLIHLTCEKRPAQLNTATTMTGSGKSIKERIALIVKKPKMAVYTLVAVVIIAAVAVGCTFTGAEEKDTPWQWAQSLRLEHITSAVPWSSDGDMTALTDQETEELVKLLNALKQDSFTQNDELAGGTPTYGLTLTTPDGEYHINESIAPAGTLEMSCGDGQWWIDDAALAEFVEALMPASSSTHQIMFPASTEEKTEYNQEIFEITPFRVQFTLPVGWSVGDFDAEANTYLYNGVWSRMGIFDKNGTCIGAIGYNIFEWEEDSDPVPMAVYNQIALGNNYQFNVHDSYEVVSRSDTSEVATADVYYAPNFDSDWEDGEPSATNYGIMAYDRINKVYVCMELDHTAVTKEESQFIASTVQFLAGDAPPTYSDGNIVDDAYERALLLLPEIKSTDPLPTISKDESQILPGENRCEIEFPVYAPSDLALHVIVISYVRSETGESWVFEQSKVLTQYVEQEEILPTGFSVTADGRMEEIGRTWAEAFIAQYVDAASADDLKRSRDAAVFKCAPYASSVSTDPKRLIYSMSFVCDAVDPNAFMLDSGFWAEPLGDDGYPQYSGWMNFGWYVVLELSDIDTWTCIDVGTGGYGGWGYLNYDESSEVDFLMENVFQGEDGLSENLLRVLPFLDWTTFDVDNWNKLYQVLDRCCLTEGRVYGPEETRMWKDVYPADQEYRNMYVMLTALNTDGAYTEGLCEILKKQYEYDPELFESCIEENLTTDQREIILSLMNGQSDV